MLYHFVLPYTQHFHLANLVHYTTFRVGAAAILSFLICFIFGGRFIKFLKTKQKYGQPIRDDGPDSHKIKSGTPTMGGIMILISVVVTTLLLVDLTNLFIWSALFVFVSFAALGFVDDYKKVVHNNSKGISGKMKLLIQLAVSVIAIFLVNYNTKPELANVLYFPFFKNLALDLGAFYILFAAFVVVGSSNAVNLTDGLDGLAIVPVAIVAICFCIISYLVGSKIYANYLQLNYIKGATELSIICAAILGSGLGFLWYNAKPAEVFMGDTGSLSLGGLLAIISIMVKHEIVLAITGGVFVIETLSVIIQVYYFKYTGGKRFFLMAPLHHHFEKLGWSETKVVTRFWIVAIIFALIGLASLKIR